MRRVPNKKTTPKERELNLVNQKIASSQSLVDSLKKEKSAVEKEILINNKLVQQLEEKKEIAKEELEKSKILLSKKDKEVFALHNVLSNLKKEIGSYQIFVDKVKANKNKEIEEFEDKLSSIKKGFETAKMTYGEELDDLKKEQEMAHIELNKIDIAIGSSKDAMSKKSEELASIDEEYKEKKNRLEKMKSASESYTGIATDLRADINALKDKKEIALKELAKIDDELMKVEAEKEKILIKSQELKEQNLLLIQREDKLNKKEAHIAELYKKAGLILTM